MFFDDPKQIEAIIKKTGFSIFIFPDESTYKNLKIKTAIEIQPTEKSSITLEDLEIIKTLTKTIQTSPRIFLIKHSHLLIESALNSLLKHLEEPHENVHFAFFTHSPNILNTVKSRAHIYFHKPENPTNLRTLSEKSLKSAKSFIAANKTDLLNLSKTIKTREEALDITEAAIELLYKSYLKTGNPKLLIKLTKFLKLEENLKKNGHLRLHLVADLI
jgi:DNA polymerase III delta prime subunit